MTTAANVRVGVTGGVYGAPTDSTLPTDNAAELDAAFEELGYVSEDGVVQAINSDTTEIKAWQNADVVRKIQTSHDLTYALTFLETNDAVLEAYYGTNAAAGVVEVTGAQGTRQAWVIEVIDGDEVIRIAIPDGQITDRGDVTYANAEAIAYPITITCYPDADGVKAYIYTGAAS
jgi:hypothetical protein